MSEAPAEDAAEQSMPIADTDASEADDQRDSGDRYPTPHSDEVDPADAAEQNLEVPDYDDDRR